MDEPERRLLTCWLVLVLATIGSFQTADLPDAQIVIVAVLLITFCKVLLVIFEFMEVRFAPLGLKLTLAAWAIIVPLGLSALWLAALG